MSTQADSDLSQNELWTVKEVAVYLRVSWVTIWRWCQLGILPAIRVGRNWRLHRDDIKVFLEKSVTGEAKGETPDLPSPGGSISSTHPNNVQMLYLDHL
jgi:excisionase family DNA binding protein